MSDEDIDYMSDEFLFASSCKGDIRPGLIHSHSVKHKIAVAKRNEEASEVQRKSLSSKDRLNEGLSTALTESNKGFAMLQKMGYRPGMALGKKDAGGRLEPVRVDIKNDRVGFGWKERIEEKRRQKLQKTLNKMKEEITKFDPHEFRNRMRHQHQAKQVIFDLRKSQKVCHELDTRDGVNEPPELWFWPIYYRPREDKCENEEEDKEKSYAAAAGNSHLNDTEDDWDEFNNDCQETEDEFEVWEQQEILTDYLRSTYFYCIWCGTKYDDDRDLSKNCPGNTRSDHE